MRQSVRQEAAQTGRGGALSVEAVTKWFGTYRALDAVSLEIRSNEFFTLLGPSGCGKTTLLRMIAGFESSSEGRILLDGNPISSLPPYERPINTVFQSYALFPHMTVAANVGFGLKMQGRAEAEIADTVREMLRLVQLDRIRADQLKGSWAGAIGHGQFMPSAVLEFGVDLDDNGVTDLCGEDPTDALASVANYLKKHGWRKGQPWGIEVQLPPGFDHALTGLDQTLPSKDWSAQGVTTVDGGALPDYGATSILLPVGARGAALLTTRNFHVILRYNRAISYAIAIGHLSDRLVGGKPFVTGWPEDDRVLSSGDISEVQYLLSRYGYDTLGIDGMIGPNTTRAARAFQTAQGLTPDGHVGGALLDALRGNRG